MDQRHVQYYRDLIAKNPDKKDLILDGAYALYSSGNKFDTPPDLDTILNYGKQYQADQPFEITKGLKSKTQSMQGFLHGAVGLAGDMVGSDTIRDYGYEGYKRNMAEAQEVAPRVGRVEDINSIGDASDWLMGTIGGLGPDFGEMLATTFIGGMAGSAIPGAGTTAGAIVGATSRKAIREVIEGAIEKQIGKKIASGIEREVAEKVVREEAESLITREIKKAAGKKAGLVLGVAPLEAGGMYGKDADERGIENANPWSAAVLGTASAMTESSGAVGDLATNGLKRPTKSEAVKSYLSDSFGEAGQELVQTGLGDVNRLVNNPDAQISGSEYLNAGAGGFVGGSAAHLPSLGLSMARKDPKAPQDIIKSARGETGAPIKESPVGDGTIAEQEVAVLNKPGPIINSNPTETMGLKAPGATVPEATPFTKGLATGGIAPQSEIETPAWVDDQTAPITGKGVGLVVPSVQPMPVEERPAVNAGLQIAPETEPIQEPDVFNARAEATLDDGIKYTYGENKAGKPSIFAHDQTGKLLDAVTYKNHEIASNEFIKLTEPVQEAAPIEQPIVPAMGLQAMPKAEAKKPAVPAKGLSLDQDEFGGMGLPVYESKPTDIPVSPQINMAEELGDKPVSSPEKAPTSDRKPYMDFVEKKVKELGSSEAENDFYKTDKPVDQYARDYAKSVYGEAKKPVKEPFKAPEGVMLTSTGGPFKISGAKKAAARHTKSTGEAAEIVPLGGSNYGWRVKYGADNRNSGDLSGDSIRGENGEIGTVKEIRQEVQPNDKPNQPERRTDDKESDGRLPELNSETPPKNSSQNKDTIPKSKSVVANETPVDAPQTDLTLKSDTQKEPWQMPRDKFIDYAEKEVGKKRTDINETGLSTAGTSYEDIWKSTHESEVKKAFDSGMAVPDEVMAEYPKLKKKEPPISKTEEPEKKKSISEIRASHVLDKPSRYSKYPGMTKRQVMEKVAEGVDGSRVVEGTSFDSASKKRDQEIAINGRKKWLLIPENKSRGSNENIPAVKEAYAAIERLEKDDYKKPDYRLYPDSEGNSFWNITKTEYDYYKSISKTETTGQRKTEKLDWFVNYTERENTGRTTEIKRFGTLRDAEEFANGKYGYITRTSDGGSDYDLSKSKTKLIKYFGGFEPSAQEVLTIKNITRVEEPKESDLNDGKADQPSVETVTEPVKAESSKPKISPEQAIKISADDIESLRKPDVFRVLDTYSDNAKEIAEYIKSKRPELSAEVDDSMKELNLTDKDIEISESPSGKKDIRIDMSKKEADSLKPKEQKEYLLKEIDAAISKAPDRFGFDENNPFKAELVEFHIPGDGSYSIINSKDTLTEFKKMASAFPASDVIKHEIPSVYGKGSYRKGAVRPEGFPGEYTRDPYQPYKKNFTILKSDRDSFFTSGDYVSNGRMVIKKKVSGLEDRPGVVANFLANNPDDSLEPIGRMAERYNLDRDTWEGQEGASAKNTPKGGFINGYVIVEGGGLVQGFNPEHIDTMLTEFPDSEMFVPKKKKGVGQAPLFFKQGGEVVGVVMPYTDAEKQIKDIKKHWSKTEDEPSGSVEEKAASEKPSENKTTEITDVGEKLGGARKDTSSSGLGKKYTDDEIKTQPFSKIWPKPDVKDLDNTLESAFIYAARKEVPTKPRKGYKLASWIKQVQFLRDFSNEVQEGRFTKEGFEKPLMDSKPLREFYGRVKLYQLIDKSLWDKINHISDQPDAYTYDGKTGSKTPSPVAYVNNKSFQYKKSVSEVIPEIEKHLSESSGTTSKNLFEVRGTTKKGYSINRTGDPEYRPLKTFETSKEAFDYIKTNKEELDQAWEDVKARDNVHQTDVRRKENRPRVSEDYRKGKDVSGEEFMNKFGFRGVEFGNWVKQGKNDKERQAMVNSAYDALMDLSKILGISPEAISLNGELGLGFGSRGHGAASAHYEPDGAIINLTKPNGAGALAHEWFHALDNYFQKKRGAGGTRETSYLSYEPEASYRHISGMTLRGDVFNSQGMSFKKEDWTRVEGVRPEVESKWADVVGQINKSDMSARSERIDKGKTNGYWSRIIEKAARSFENYVVSKMKDDGYHNDYLANVATSDEFVKDDSRYPYLMDSEMGPIKNAFDSLFAEIKTRKTDKGTELYSKSTPTGPAATISELSKPQRAEVEKLQKAGKVNLISNDEAMAILEKSNGMMASFAGEKAKTADLDSLEEAFYFLKSKPDLVRRESGWFLGLDGKPRFEISDRSSGFKPKKTWFNKAQGEGVRLSEAFEHTKLFEAYPHLKDIILKVTPLGRTYGQYDHSANTITISTPLFMQEKEARRTMLHEIQHSIQRHEGFALGAPPSLFEEYVVEDSNGNTRSLDPWDSYMRTAGEIEARDVSERSRRPDIYNKLSRPYSSQKKKYTSNPIRVYVSEDRGLEVHYSKDGKIQGFVLPNGKAYIIPENIQKNNLWNVIRHEIGVHMGQLMQNRPEFNRILKTLENLKKSDTKQGELVRKAFDRVPKDTKPEHISEEVLAYLVESAPEIGIVRRFITMVKRLLVKMGVSPMIFNQADYAALADAAIRKEAGRVSGFGKTMEGMGQFAQDAKMSIEKAKMAIQNLPAFKKWFGDSKVVDEDGGPLVVYHGTSYEGDIGAFDTSAENQLGTHFAPNKDVAVAFTGEGDGMIHEAYISVKNPYDIVSDLGDWSDMGMLEEYLSDGNDGPFTDEEFSKFKTAKDVQNGLIKKGYDGVKYENSLDIKGEHVSYIVFSPTQIKSIFNTKWNPENPDIMMSKRQISEPLYSISDAKDHVTEAIDDGIEYVKNLYERRGEIKPALQGAIKYRNEKGPGDKTDVSYLAKSFGLISHFSKSIPAMARTFNAALRNSDIKTMVEQQLTHGADGEKFIQTIDRFRRKMKDEYNQLDRYLHNRDLNQIGYRVKELDLDKATDLGGKYVVVDLKHKDTSHVYETENEAWEKVMDLEAEDYIQDGGSQEAANVLKLFRTINNRSFDLRISRFREVEQYCRDHGVEIPKIVYEEEGKEIQVDLKQKLIEMGDRRGYYMPRIRKPGEHMLYAKKDGSSPIMKFYDLKTVANMAKGSFESKGYTVTVRQAGNLSEDLFEQLGSILSQQALINESMKEINKGNRVVALKDLDIKSEMDGDTLVLSGDFKDEFIPTLEKRGGVKKVREHFSGKTKIVTIEYRFENAKKNLEEDLSKELFKIDGVTNLLQDVALRFAGAFVSQYADVIRSRGSRSAMIGRSDKVGDEVTLGFEEDAITRVVRSVLSLAGGEAKSRTALSMIESITGRDIKWAKFSEIKRFEGTFEEFEKQALENDEQYIDRATFEEIKNKWDGEPQYLDYIEFLDNRGIDPGKQKNAHSESISLFKDIMRNDERVDRFVGTIQGLAVLKFLAFRVSSPAVNLLNMVVAVPAVMNGFGKIPLRKTYKLIANAYKDYVAFTNNTLENKEMVKVFSEIEKRGWGKQTLNQEGIRALQNKLQFGYSKMLETSMMLFAFTEKLNRVGTIAATYKGLLVSMPNLTFEERLNKAHEISNDAHGIYGKANRPSIIRGGGVAANVLQMGYVFKVFMHQFLSTMYRLGFVEKERTAALYMAFFPAIFGIGSSIGAKAILTAMSLLPGSDDPEEELYKIIESRFGTYAGNFSRFGVFGMFGNGISVKGSMEVGGISDLPSSFKDFVGAPGAVFTDIRDGLGELTRGNGMKAAEKFLPTGLGAPVKAYREYTEGITTKSNAPVFFEGKPLKADAIDAFLRFWSFNPSRIAGAREKLWGEKVSEQAFMERRKDIYSRVKKYYLDTDRDPEDLQDIEIDIAAYNQRAKNSGQTVIKAKNIKSILKRAKIEE